jgi:hypothetical protein
MSRGLSSSLYWTPRLLSILFIIFISLFALDIFGQGYSLWQTVVGLFMHLIPTIILIIVLSVCWRWEWVGAILYFGLGVLYLVLSWGRFDWTAYLSISGPCFLLSILFFMNWLLLKRPQKRTY